VKNGEWRRFFIEIHAKHHGVPRGGRIKQSKGYLGEEDQTEHGIPRGGGHTPITHQDTGCLGRGGKGWGDPLPPP